MFQCVFARKTQWWNPVNDIWHASKAIRKYSFFHNDFPFCLPVPGEPNKLT